ncbi:hypothetical protein KCU61_g1553, partial [Aureobasidium melanogenum]
MMTIKYDRDIAVEAIRSYYKFLTTIPAIQASDILEPPTGGWPSIITTSLAILGKDEIVIDLLRHLPYIRRTHSGNENISYDTVAINYSNAKLRDNRSLDNLVPTAAGSLPAHVVSLTIGARYGSYLLLDTQQGTITDYIMMERPERSHSPFDDPDHWRAYKTLPITEFFSEWEEMFRSLQWVALSHRSDDGVLLNHDRSTEVTAMEVREIYRNYGWPDAYRREECQHALIAWDKNNSLSHANATRSKTPPTEATTIPAISPVESSTPGEFDGTFPDGSAVGSAFGVGVMVVEDVLEEVTLDDDADAAGTSDVLADEELVVLVALEVLVLVEAPLNAVEDAAIATRALVYLGQHASSTPAPSSVQLTAPGCPQEELKSA